MAKAEPEQKYGNKQRRTQISDIRREELTLAALRCIAERGYAQVRLDDVAREAGFSKGVAFYYFKNKEELLVSVIKKMWDDLMELFQLVWAIPDDFENEEKLFKHLRRHYSDTEIDIEQVMREGLKYVLSWLYENPDVIRVVLEFWCEVPRNEMIRDLTDGIQTYIRKISALVIKEGMKRKIFKKRDPELAAYTLLSALHGLGFYYAVRLEEYDYEKFEKEVTDLIFTYLRG